MKKKILIVSNNLNIGGVQKSLVSLLQSFDYSLYEVDLLLKTSNGALKNSIPNEVNIISPPEYFKWIFIPKGKIFNAFFTSIGFNLNAIRLLYCVGLGILSGNMGKARQYLWRLSRKSIPKINKEYDIAIDYTGGLKSLIIDKVNAIKKVTWVHSDYRVFKRDKKIDHEDYRKIDIIFCVSKTCQDIFKSEFPAYTNKTFILPNIINKKQILELSKENVDFDNEFDGLRIMDITRLDPNKGLDIAIKACRKMVDTGLNIRWYILGGGEERGKLENMIKQYKLEDRFFLIGQKTNPYPYIRRADMIVHCSLFEGRSVAIDEAMLLAKPIILTDYPTAKDQIQNEVNGIIVETSEDGVIKGINKIINDNVLRDKLIQNLLDYDIPAKKTIDIFNKSINGGI